MNNNIFKRIICMVIALMLIMPALPSNLVSAKPNEDKIKDTTVGTIAGTTTSSAISLKVNVELYRGSGEKEVVIDTFQKTFTIDNYDSANGTTVTYKDMIKYGILSNYGITSFNNSIYTENNLLDDIDIPKGEVSTYTYPYIYEIHLKKGNGNVSWLVIFKDWDGDILKTEWVTDGGNAIPPINPEKSGFTFAGWYGTYTNVTKDEIVTATYNKNEYTVTFEAGSNGSLTGTTVYENVSHGTFWGTAVPTLPTPVADPGYKFEGWTPSPFASKITQNLSYTANFFIDEDQWHTVTFISGENGSLKGTKLFEDILDGTAWETAITTVPTPVADIGYKFIGWTPSAFANNVIEDLEYTANFALDDGKSHTVTFIAGDNGNLTGTTIYNVPLGTAWETAVTIVPTPVADKGYKFDGWTPTPFAATVTEELVYTANFVIDVAQWHTVTFIAGANGTLTGTTLYANILDGTAWETAVTVPTPVADKGYKFDGWTPTPFAATVTEDLVYTANFVLNNVLSHNVTFVAGANGTLDGTTLFSNILDGTEWVTAVTVPTPVADKGYKFDGWTPTPFAATVTEDLVYTANFVEKEDGGNNGGGNDDKDKDDDDENEPTITIDDSQTPAGGPIVEPEVPEETEETEEPEVIEELEKIEEPEVPQGTLPDTGSVLNTTLLAAIGLLLIIAGMFINKFKLIRG